MLRSLDLQKLPNNLVPCLAPKSVHTVRPSNLGIHVCSSDLCYRLNYVIKFGLELANPFCDSMQFSNLMMTLSQGALSI